jgi:hypothetical protein
MPSSSAVKRKLSGSTDGLAIKVTQTSTPGDLIHTAVAGQVDGTYDEIWLWAYNGHTADVVLTIEFGGVAVPDNTIVQTIPFKKGKFLIEPGSLLQNAKVVRAFAAVANVITISGHVHRMADPE